MDKKYIPGKGSFGANLDGFLKSKHINPSSLAKKMGVHHSTLYGWINGRTLPTVTMLFRLADAVNTPVNDLLGFVTPSDWALDRNARPGGARA